MKLRGTCKKIAWGGLAVVCVAVSGGLMAADWPHQGPEINGISVKTKADPVALNKGAEAMPTLQDIANRLETGAAAADAEGFREPPGPYPEGAMPTLSEIMDLMPAPHTNAATPMHVREGKVFWSLDTNDWGIATGAVPVQVVSPHTNVLQAGFYDTTVWAEVETNLVPQNIRQDAVILGTTGTVALLSPWPAPVPRTGVTTSEVEFDDGYYRPGEPWPEPRFLVDTGNATNVVTDRLTGLMWVRSPSGTRTLNSALHQANSANHGGYNDWRLANVREYLSLFDYGKFSPALPAGHPFILPTSDENLWFHTSTPSRHTGNVRYYKVDIVTGWVDENGRPNGTKHSWLVRGGILP